jgi:acetyl-CoA acetyltransferase
MVVLRSNRVECHNCFSAAELFMYEALGLCPEGQGGNLVETGKWVGTKVGGSLFQVGDGKQGKWVVNPTGGLECKGNSTIPFALVELMDHSSDGRILCCVHGNGLALHDL